MLSSQILAEDPEASIGIITRVFWRREQIDTVFAGEQAFPVRRWDLAMEDPGTVALIQTVVARLPNGTSVADAREAALDAVDPADIDALQLVDEAFEILEESDATTAKAAVRSVRVADPNQTIGPGVHLLNAHTGKGQQFDWVFVIGIEEDHVPLKRSNRGEALAEEERVLLGRVSLVTGRAASPCLLAQVPDSHSMVVGAQCCEN